jgi:hypothetical protein
MNAHRRLRELEVPRRPLTPKEIEEYMSLHEKLFGFKEYPRWMKN